MHLSVSQKKLDEEIGDEYRREQLTAKIRDTENLISESEKKIAAKEIPMYVHCRQEEKGTSQDTSNYVYRIKQEKRLSEPERLLLILQSIKMERFV